MFWDLIIIYCKPSILSSSHMSFTAIPWRPIITRIAYLLYATLGTMVEGFIELYCDSW